MSAPFFKDVWCRPWKLRDLIRGSRKTVEMFDCTNHSFATINWFGGKGRQYAELMVKAPQLLTTVQRLMALISTHHAGDLDQRPEMVEARALCAEIEKDS